MKTIEKIGIYSFIAGLIGGLILILQLNISLLARITIFAFCVFIACGILVSAYKATKEKKEFEEKMKSGKSSFAERLEEIKNRDK